MVATRIRVPRIQGCSPQIRGSLTILPNHSSFTIFASLIPSDPDSTHRQPRFFHCSGHSFCSHNFTDLRAGKSSENPASTKMTTVRSIDKFVTSSIYLNSFQSGRVDLNHRPPAPKAGALTRLRYAPCCRNGFVRIFHCVRFRVRWKGSTAGVCALLRADAASL